MVFSRQKAKFLPVFAIFGLVGLLAVTGCAKRASYTSLETPVFTDLVKGVPQNRYTNLSPVTELTAFKEKNGWTRIRLANGRLGWVRSANLLNHAVVVMESGVPYSLAVSNSITPSLGSLEMGEIIFIVSEGKDSTTFIRFPGDSSDYIIPSVQGLSSGRELIDTALMMKNAENALSIGHKEEALALLREAKKIPTVFQPKIDERISGIESVPVSVDTATSVSAE